MGTTYKTRFVHYLHYLQLPKDIMHTVLQGVVQYEARFLLYTRNGTLALYRINGAILSVPYSSIETSNLFINQGQ